MSTWMVVEDEPDIYDVLLAMFEIWGIEGVAFVDGGDAVAWIDDVDKGNMVGELPELAILDIRVPEVSGPEIGARLRKSEKLSKIAIVLITAYRLDADKEEEAKRLAQADALMYKPLPAMPDLRRVLDQIIARRKEASDSLSTEQVAIPTIPSPTTHSLNAQAAQSRAGQADNKPAVNVAPSTPTSAAISTSSITPGISTATGNGNAPNSAPSPGKPPAENNASSITGAKDVKSSGKASTPSEGSGSNATTSTTPTPNPSNSSLN